MSGTLCSPRFSTASRALPRNARLLVGVSVALPVTLSDTAAFVLAADFRFGPGVTARLVDAAPMTERGEVVGEEVVGEEGGVDLGLLLGLLTGRALALRLGLSRPRPAGEGGGVMGGSSRTVTAEVRSSFRSSR